MKSDRTTRPMRAVYDVTFYDWDWNEIPERRLVRCSAIDIFNAVNAWHAEQQRIARDPAIVICPLPSVLSIGIEVYYVES
jgi:hypothetical protein